MRHMSTLFLHGYETTPGEKRATFGSRPGYIDLAGSKASYKALISMSL